MTPVCLILALSLTLVFESAQANPFKRGPPDQIDENEEDDISIPDLPLSSSNDARSKRMAWSHDIKWPKSGDTVTIPYTTSGVDDSVVQRAIEVFNAKTCIRFVPRGSESDYVAFASGNSCQSCIGKQEGSQSLTLTSRCAGNKGKVLHELLHALGFLHEQCRPDRDSYITVNQGNIRSGASTNFAIQAEHVDLGIPYDCDSILHYKATAFSSNGQPTITSSYCTAIGNGDKRLSLLDYKRVNSFYSCDNPTYIFFTVRVVTDGSWMTGTDCFIYIKLHGTQRTSTEFEMDLDDAESANLFESGSDDTFSKMAFRNDLGTITGISVRMVANGSGEAWWPTQFIVTDPVNNQQKTFTNKQWLSPSSTYGPSSFPSS